MQELTPSNGELTVACCQGLIEAMRENTRPEGLAMAKEQLQEMCDEAFETDQLQKGQVLWLVMANLVDDLFEASERWAEEAEEEKEKATA